MWNLLMGPHLCFLRRGNFLKGFLFEEGRMWNLLGVLYVLFIRRWNLLGVPNCLVFKKAKHFQVPQLFLLRMWNLLGGSKCFIFKDAKPSWGPQLYSYGGETFSVVFFKKVKPSQELMFLRKRDVRPSRGPQECFLKVWNFLEGATVF